MGVVTRSRSVQHLAVVDSTVLVYRVGLNISKDWSTDWGTMAEWLARRIRDLEVAGSIPDHAMLQLP
ncbi:hypothetical protein ElyMa_004701000 [Elysia marginata]|uniref:Uncharacterized protein n=1 Tax=Elysia marginata TaxID=1093978 RepID=A0AAV4I7H5_9GAST|nr:hypothetical protein ElyMa_004701000 [Elysia marginata]